MSESKKFDSGKLRYDLIPPEVLEALAEIYTFGSEKYGDNCWQTLENFDDRYYAAAARHLQAHRMGESFDKESGKLHLAHALCNVSFLCWKEINNVLEDSE